MFLTRSQFATKLMNWDFFEYVNYGKEWYAESKYFEEDGDYVIIQTPMGKLISEEYLKPRNIKTLSVFLKIQKETQEKRLSQRWDSESEISRRKRDDLSHTWYDLVIDWEKPTEIIAEEIISFLNTNGI